MQSDFEDEQCHLMATDEVDAYEQLELAEDFALFYKAFEERRKGLSEIDLKRIESFAYQPDDIQAIFDRLGLPFNYSAQNNG